MAEEQAHIALGAGGSVPVVLVRHPRARGYRLRLDRAGTARLTLPARGSARAALAWAREQSAWLTDQLARRDAGICRLADGATFPLEGTPVTIAWRADAGRTVRLEGAALVVGGPATHVGDRVLRWLKAQARDLLTAETLALAGAQGLAVASVGIGDPVSRWGSCSAAGAIRYSWRLILAPTWVRRSTVAHEVAHLRHMDHSAAFHAFYRAICPGDADAARAWLRAQGAELHRIGI